MKKTIGIKSWQCNFRKRYPDLRRAVMIQRAMQAIYLYCYPRREQAIIPVIIYRHFCERRGCYAFGENEVKRN